MELTEAYKKVVATIQSLEKQLALCDSSTIGCEQSVLAVQKEIDDHFAQCMNALAARKETLMKEVAQKLTHQRSSVEAARKNLVTAIEASKQMLHSSSTMYSFNKQVVETIWHDITLTQIPNIMELRVSIDLPHDLLGSICKHGTVNESLAPGFHFSVADSVVTFAGSSQGRVDGNKLQASFHQPWGICFNPRDECFYVCDSANGSIRKVTLQGSVSTFVKGLSRPMEIAMHYKENIFYVTDQNSNSIVKITATGNVSVLAGSSPGSLDGEGSAAKFSSPLGIAVDQQSGVIFVSDYGSSLIRKITPQGAVTTLAGSVPGFENGNGRSAKFSCPYGICYDAYTQSLLVCDYNNCMIRRVQMNGDVSTVCKVANPGSVAVVGNAITVGATNKIFRVISKDKHFEAVDLAGSGKQGNKDGKPDTCEFGRIYGIAVHEPSHSCFVSDYGTHTIKKISYSS